MSGGRNEKLFFILSTSVAVSPRMPRASFVDFVAVYTPAMSTFTPGASKTGFKNNPAAVQNH
jgi:hypothetical protein